MIKTEALTKFYGKARGISQIDLAIDEGEIFGFIGPNGAGKSTLIRILLGIIYPTSGNAFINGMDCVKESKAVKQFLGYTPSEVNYYDDMTVEELLRYSANFYHKDCRARAVELAQYLELPLNKKINALSYGNKKKAAIVQALQHEPKVLIFDEPTGGLDPLIQNKFFELLQEEKRKGTTILFSSHILSEVQKVCDRVAIIREGELLKVESIDSLRKNQLKQLMIESEAALPIHQLAQLTNIQQEGQKISCLYSGKLDELTAFLAAYPVTNLTITDPPLEEVFLHYYEKGA